MQYYPMPDLVKEQCKNRYSYTVVVNLYASQDDIEDYINRNVRINSDEKLDEDELAQGAADVVYGLIETHPKFADYDLVQIVGIAFANAYDRELG